MSSISAISNNGLLSKDSALITVNVTPGVRYAPCNNLVAIVFQLYTVVSNIVLSDLKAIIVPR